MSDNWVVQNLENALETWNSKLSEIWQLLTTSPQEFKGGSIWSVMVNINGAVQAIGLALLVLFFVVGVVRTCGSFTDVKKPEHALKLFIRFAIAKGVITYGLELMLALFNIVQGTISTIMTSAGFGTPNQTTLPAEMVTTIESCGFFESIPLWAVTLIGGLFILIPETGDELDVYREEYNKMLLDKATGANAIVQDKYVTISINKKSVEDARTYFARVGADLIAHFARLGSKCVELETDERLRIVHDFFRVGEETAYHFNIKETRKKGHDFKDYVCPDTMEFEKDYFKMGNRYGRVLFLREYASYIKDSMVAELTDLNRNLMMSIDIVPVPTDEAVREAESRLLGVETNITNWQRRLDEKDLKPQKRISAPQRTVFSVSSNNEPRSL